jgi:hypothetical protein
MMCDSFCTPWRDSHAFTPRRRFHAASAVIGATVFYVAALAPLLPDSKFDALTPDQAAAHKRDAVRTVRLLLGIRARAPRKGRVEARGSAREQNHAPAKKAKTARKARAAR